MPRSHPQRVQFHWSKVWPGYQDLFKLQMRQCATWLRTIALELVFLQRTFGGAQSKCTLFLSIALTFTSKWALSPFYPRICSSPLLLIVPMVSWQHGLRILRLLGFQAASLLEVENIHLLDGKAKTESFIQKFHQKMCSRTVHTILSYRHSFA